MVIKKCQTKNLKKSMVNRMKYKKTLKHRYLEWRLKRIEKKIKRLNWSMWNKGWK